MIGREGSFDEGLTRIQRLYVRFLGAPEIGARIRHRITMAHVLDAGFSRLLDAGCGKAYSLFWMARQYPHGDFTGLEGDAVTVKRNRNIKEHMGLTNIHFHRHDLLKEFSGDRFDLILSVDVLEHIEDDGLVLQRLARSLKPEGKLIVHVPAAQRKYFFKSSYDYVVPDHVREGYGSGELERKLEKSGFRVTEARKGYNFFETLANEIGTFLSKHLWLYALALPFLDLLSRVPQPLADAVRPVRNSLLFVAEGRENESGP